MSDKVLFTYYSISEAPSPDKVIKKLNSLDDKISYEMMDSETFKIEDVELSEKELDSLIDFFDKNDVIPDMDKTEEDWNDVDYSEDDEEDENY